MSATRRDSAAVVAEHAAELTYDALPVALIEHTKVCVLDTIASAMAGSGTSDVAALRRIATGWGGSPDCTALGFGERYPAYAAVLLNCAMAHQYDFDDTHDTAVCHPGSAAVLPALAMAESVGGIGGRELIAAVVAGVDLSSRLGLAIDGTLWDFPWVRAPVVGIFGAALSAGKVLGLDANGLHHALGLALSQAGGTLQCLEGSGSAVRGMRDGLIYKDAILAALLAAEGVRGDEDAFDGRYGLFNAFFGGRYDRDAVVAELGERYEGLNVSLKPWPSCRHTHATLTALYELMARDGFDRSALREVVVRVGDGNARLTDPLGDSFGGRMSVLCNLPFALGVSIARGALATSSFDEATYFDPDVRGAAELLRFERDPSHNRHGTIEPGHVTFRFADGAEWTAAADRALGHPERPMPAAALAEKVRLAAADAAEPPAERDVEALIEMTLRLEEVDDVRSLARLTSSAATREK